MQLKLAISFQRRGVPGLLCITLGIGLCCVFRKSSAWPEEAKHLVLPIALLLALCGVPLLNSYVHQRPWQAMRTELRGLAALAAGWLAWQLCGWLMAL